MLDWTIAGKECTSFSFMHHPLRGLMSDINNNNVFADYQLRAISHYRLGSTPTKSQISVKGAIPLRFCFVDR